MKNAIFLLSFVSLCSCERDWYCCTETTNSGHPSEFSQLNGVEEECFEFRGDREEKKSWEAIRTRELNDVIGVSSAGTVYYYSISESTICLPKQ